MDKKHELLSDLKSIALSLGKVPTRDEYSNATMLGANEYRKVFGSFTTMLQASGLKDKSPKKEDKQAAKRRIEEFFGCTLRDRLNREEKTSLLPSWAARASLHPPLGTILYRSVATHER